MPKVHSFKDYIKNSYYNDLWDVLFEYIADNPAELDLYTYKIQQPSEAELCEMNIRRIDVNDAPKNAIFFDVIVDTEIWIAEKVRRNKETANKTQWFRISCSGILDGTTFADFTINEVAIYEKKNFNKTDTLSSKGLVPIIYKEDFDAVAETFLAQYYKEALEKPTPVDVVEVVQRMGLVMEEARLSQYFTLFGQMVFDDCEVNIWNDGGLDYEKLGVKCGTILIDPNVSFMRNIGSRNNTIIHECIHWFKHRKYHWLQGLFSTGSASIKCAVDEIAYSSPKKEWTEWDWMEWHANGIAPRVLMPKKQTEAKIEELVEEFEKSYGKDNRLEVLEATMYELAEFFGVSILSAKIRMLDLGYTEAEGVSTYIDDHYIDNYAFDIESKNSDQTYHISIRDGFFLYCTNTIFRNLLDTGKFIYVDARYVLDDPKYVECLSGGGIAFTEYGRMHTDECCLRFDLEINTNRTSVAAYQESLMFKDITLDYTRIPGFNTDNHNMKFFESSPELKRFYVELAEEISVDFETQQNFAKVAWNHIRRNKLNKETFQQKTLLSGKMYDRIKNDNVPKPSLETAMALAIGLKLGGKSGEELLEKAGHKLTDTPLHLTYRKLLNVCKEKGILGCNEILEHLSFPPLCEKEYRDVTPK